MAAGGTSPFGPATAMVTVPLAQASIVVEVTAQVENHGKAIDPHVVESVTSWTLLF